MRARRKMLTGAALAGLALVAISSAQAKASNLIESWEGTLDGWQVPSPFGTQTTYVPGFSTTTGVTDGTDSLSIGSASASPNYGQMAISAPSQTITSILGGSQSISLDVYTPPASFGFFLQFDMDINNADTGFQSLDGFSYPATTIGAEHTLTFNLTPAETATLAASANPTTIIIQIGGGFTAGNETMFLDNLRGNPVPEPASMGLLGGAGLLALRRRRR